MKDFRRQAPTVNAGSMADIAFLLLIFFLVTTTISTDKGILRTLPKKCITNDCYETIPERNILKILINAKDEIMIDEELAEIDDVKDAVKAFVDNNGNGNCDYCMGYGLDTLSDEPSKAVISLKADALSSYKAFIAIQDELSQAYFELRVDYAKNIFDKEIDHLLEDELKATKQAYPFLLSEAEIE